MKKSDNLNSEKKLLQKVIQAELSPARSSITSLPNTDDPKSSRMPDRIEIPTSPKLQEIYEKINAFFSEMANENIRENETLNQTNTLLAQFNNLENKTENQSAVALNKPPYLANSPASTI